MLLHVATTQPHANTEAHRNATMIAHIQTNTHTIIRSKIAFQRDNTNAGHTLLDLPSLKQTTVNTTIVTTSTETLTTTTTSIITTTITTIAWLLAEPIYYHGYFAIIAVTIAFSHIMRLIGAQV